MQINPFKLPGERMSSQTDIMAAWGLTYTDFIKRRRDSKVHFMMTIVYFPCTIQFWNAIKRVHSNRPKEKYASPLKWLHWLVNAPRIMTQFSTCVPLLRGRASRTEPWVGSRRQFLENTEISGKAATDCNNQLQELCWWTIVENVSDCIICLHSLMGLQICSNMNLKVHIGVSPSGGMRIPHSPSVVTRSTY